MGLEIRLLAPTSPSWTTKKLAIDDMDPFPTRTALTLEEAVQYLIECDVSIVLPKCYETIFGGPYFFKLRICQEKANELLDRTPHSNIDIAIAEQAKVSLIIALSNEYLAAFEEAVTAIEAGKPSLLRLDQSATDKAGEPMIRKASILLWSRERSGAVLPPIDQAVTDASLPSSKESATWDGVTIDFRAHNKLHLSLPGGKSKTIDLDSTGLFDKRYKHLNTAGAALLGLATIDSIMKKPGTSGKGIIPKTMSELRSSLKKLSNIKSDPFYPYNEVDGWKPRFKVQDRRNAADERAKEKAVHVPYRDERHGTSLPPLDPFSDENSDDPAAQFLREHDR